jgi:hypothetical protein
VPWWVRIDREGSAPTEPEADGPPPCADLVITAFTISPALPVVGMNAQIDVTVLNQGTCSRASSQWRPDRAPERADHVRSRLAAAATVSFQYAFRMRHLTIIRRRLDDTVSELNESNNLAIRSVSVLDEQVDLLITELRSSPPRAFCQYPPPVAGRLHAPRSPSRTRATFRWVTSAVKPTLPPPLSRQVNGLGPGGSTTLTFDHTYPVAGQSLHGHVMPRGSRRATSQQHRGVVVVVERLSTEIGPRDQPGSAGEGARRAPPHGEESGQHRGGQLVVKGRPPRRGGPGEVD